MGGIFQKKKKKFDKVNSIHDKNVDNINFLFVITYLAIKLVYQNKIFNYYWVIDIKI